MPHSRLARLALAVLGGTAAVFVAAFTVLSLAYSPTYIGRMMLWQDADVQDYTRFPARDVAAAPEPFSFGEPENPVATADAVRAGLAASASVTGDPDAFLEEAGTQAFIVIQDDVILYEHYFGGFERASIATSFSVAKSYVSALVGIAIQEGAIGGADDPITKYLPELIERDARFADITIQHLLDMTSGIRYDEAAWYNGDDALTYYFDDLRSLALDRTEIEQPPGQVWLYNNYNPLLLGLILERATGVHVADYLAQKLWSRIGTEFPASWSLDRKDGFEKMESGINARPIDFAKLGRLYLDGGAWNGKQIVPADWVATSTRPTADERTGYFPTSLNRPYGTVSHKMFWWRIALRDGDYAYCAEGNYGQFIFVAPTKRLIVVRFGKTFGISLFEWFEVFTSLAENLKR